MLQEFSSGGDRTPPPAGRAAAGKYDQLWQLSMADPHTGLANQLLLLDRLTQALARRRRHGGEVVVCHIDLDNLGEINLDLGYTTGNTVLCEAPAASPPSCGPRTRSAGSAAASSSWSWPSPTSRRSGPLVRRLQQTLDEPVMVGGQGDPPARPLGLALAEDAESAEDVLARADRSTRVSNR